MTTTFTHSIVALKYFQSCVLSVVALKTEILYFFETYVSTYNVTTENTNIDNFTAVRTSVSFEVNTQC